MENRRRTVRRAVFGLFLAAMAPVVRGAPIQADFVFLIDASGSMTDEIGAVRSGLSSFVTGLSAADVEPRFAIILFGGAPELVLDFTGSGEDTEDAFGRISTSGAVAGFQQNHNVNPEAGLEAIRIALGSANNSTLLRINVGGNGGLVFRDNVRKNLILVTDEDSDRPYYSANRTPGQSSAEPPPGMPGGWQLEVAETAADVIAAQAFLNMLINPGDAPSARQYGNPASDVSDPNFLNFDAAATLAQLTLSGFGTSLQAQVLTSGLIARSFNIGDVNTPDFIENFFAAKVEETVDVIPEPSSWLLLGAGVALLLFGSKRRAGEKIS